MSTFEDRIKLSRPPLPDPALEQPGSSAEVAAPAYTNRYEIKYLVASDRLPEIDASLDGPPTGVFLELKGRYDRIVHKRRVSTDVPLAERLLHQTPVHPNGWAAESPVLRRVPIPVAPVPVEALRQRALPPHGILRHLLAERQDDIRPYDPVQSGDRPERG
jgi:hypothetical protein